MITLKTLITIDLGYCCLWVFFQRFHSTRLIAARLGLTRQCVQKHKARWRRKDYSCEQCANCMKGKLG